MLRAIKNSELTAQSERRRLKLARKLYMLIAPRATICSMAIAPLLTRELHSPLRHTHQLPAALKSLTAARNARLRVLSEDGADGKGHGLAAAQGAYFVPVC